MKTFRLQFIYAALRAFRSRLPLAALCTALVLSASLAAQTVNATQQVVLEGLLSSNAQGRFTAAAVGPNGNLYLLLDQNDGVRLIEANSTATTQLAQTQTGSTGDSGVAMAIDAAGNIYVTGTSTNASLTGTGGVAFPHRADASINSFLAKYDANLNLIFLTFLGSGRTAAASVAATADAVFVTGITFNSAFPVTAAGIQQAPALNSTENGFVERFDTSGATLVYATYLTGAKGDTVPAAIVADSNDNAYISGATSASGYPTIAALQPNVLLASSITNSGFLSKLTPAGDAFVFSTYIAGTGITGMALDASSSSLLLSGNVAPGQFPVATVAMPLTSIAYQTLLRIPTDGQSVTQSVLLAAGSTSYVSAGPSGTAWISGSLTVPFFSGDAPPDYNTGDSFLVHVTSNGSIDQTLRFGGMAVNNASYASLTSSVAAPAISAGLVFLPGAITASVSSSLLSTQRFDLPLTATPNALLPNALHDILPISTACGTSAVCTGSGAFLAGVSTSVSAASLSASIDDLPNITLRNLGSAAANGLSLSASGYTLATDCGSALAPSTLCNIVLTGSGPGSLTVSAANAPTLTATLPANTGTADAVTLNVRELDFGIVSPSYPATQTITVTNPSAQTQTFTSAGDGVLNSGYLLTQKSTDCVPSSASGTYSLTAGGSCHITLQLATASSAVTASVKAAWKIGTRDILLTGYVQPNSLTVSSSEVDFGTSTASSVAHRLPRYIYLSNTGNAPVSHTAVSLASPTPFSVSDACPSTLEPGSVCQITVTYTAATGPSYDSVTLTLDAGLTVLVTGATVPPASASGSVANPNLVLSATALTFSGAVIVTGVSSETQTLTLRNTGSTAVPVLLALAGDFTLANGCPASLAAGSGCSLVLNFAPSQPGQRQGLLSVSTGGGFSPAYVTLSGTALAVLPANNGTLSIGQTYAGEPVVAWFKVQQALTSLTVTSSSKSFGVALVADAGGGHGTLAPTAFTQMTTAPCANCWLGIELLSSTAGPQTATLSLSTIAAGNPYILALNGTVLPTQGLLLSPAQQDFASIAVNSTSGVATIALTNALSSGATVNLQSVTASGDFTVMSNSNGGAVCSGALPATATCYVQLAFTPTITGQRTGSLTIATDAGTVAAGLTGFGLESSGLSVHPTALDFEAVPGSAATQQSVTLSNSGTATVNIGEVIVSDASFTTASNCTTLAPGSVCSIVVNFTPQSGNIAATLSIPASLTVNGQLVQQSYLVQLTGGYAAVNAGLEILSSEVDFGAVAASSTGPSRQFTLNNLSGQPLNITLRMPRDFPLTTPAPCASVAAGGSCVFSVSFLPEAAGPVTGTVFAEGVAANGGATAQSLAYMLGYSAGTGQLSISTGAAAGSPVSFGQVPSGQQSVQTFTLTNAGTTPVTVRRLVSEPPFVATSNCGAALLPGAGCAVTLTYAPINEVLTGSAQTAPRADVGSLVIQSDAVSSPDIVNLTGLAAPVFSASPISSAVLAAYELSQSALTFAALQTGSASAAQTVTVTNTGNTTLHITSVLAPQDFTAATTCGTLVAGAVCTVSVQFTPTTSTATAMRSGAVEILSDAGDSLEYVSVVGIASAAPLTLSTSGLDFGQVDLGRTASLNVIVTNTGSTPVTFNGLSATGDYSVSAGTCPAVGSALAATSSCTLQVTFAPTATGTRSGTLSVASSATALPLTASLTGTGIRTSLQASPTALDFGSIAEGAVAQLSVTLSNAGTVPVGNITTALSGAAATDFAVIIPCSVALLQPGQSCSMTVAFTPSAIGQRQATLAVNSTDPNGPALVTLTGNGVQGGSFQLTVNGGSSATMTVKAGSPAVYALTLTPLNGFTGPVALTCAPVAAAQYASCSLLSSTLTLNGAALNSTATINTITAHLAGTIEAMSLLLLTPFGFLRRKRGRVGVLVLLGALTLMAVGCGGSSQVAVLKTPPGTYQYTVTASATSGASVSSTVTLNLVVQ